MGNGNLRVFISLEINDGIATLPWAWSWAHGPMGPARLNLKYCNSSLERDTIGNEGQIAFFHVHG